MSKHTEGPWEHDGKGLIYGAPAQNGDATLICDMLPDICDEMTDEMIGNINLITAATTLLKALEDADELITQLMPGVKHIVLQDYGFLNQTMLNNKAAIAKAKGEPQ